MSFIVIGLGEVLWDFLPAGPQLGGAPMNFARHAQMLGAQARVITRIGQDFLGRQVLNQFETMRLPTEWVQEDEESATGTVTVALSGSGIPQYTIHENVAWDKIVVTEAALEAVREVDALCFGSLAQRCRVSREAIQQLVAATPATALRIFDINLRQAFYSRDVIEHSLQLANVIKLNNEELPVLKTMFSLQGDPKQQLEWLRDRFMLRTLVLTCGDEGSLVCHEGQWSEQQPLPADVVDTVGAGDAFTAALTMALLNNMELTEAHGMATDVASYVCSQAGAIPALPDRFRGQFSAVSEV